MGRIIAVVNQKGGVGKTTTAVNLASAVGIAGKKVLLIDIDPQGNATSGVGVDKNQLENTVYEMIIGECKLEECILRNVIDDLDLLPSNVNLSGAEIDLIDQEDREYYLQEIFDEVKDRFDYILIDCPPALGLITYNAMIAADHLVMVTTADQLSYSGLVMVANLFADVKSNESFIESQYQKIREEKKGLLAREQALQEPEAIREQRIQQEVEKRLETAIPLAKNKADRLDAVTAERDRFREEVNEYHEIASQLDIGNGIKLQRVIDAVHESKTKNVANTVISAINYIKNGYEWASQEIKDIAARAKEAWHHHIHRHR